MTEVDEFAKFYNNGYCIARDPETNDIAAIISYKHRFKIPELTRVLFRENSKYKIRIHKDNMSKENKND